MYRKWRVFSYNVQEFLYIWIFMILYLCKNESEGRFDGCFNAICDWYKHFRCTKRVPGATPVTENYENNKCLHVRRPVLWLDLGFKWTAPSLVLAEQLWYRKYRANIESWKPSSSWNLTWGNIMNNTWSSHISHQPLLLEKAQLC